MPRFSNTDNKSLPAAADDDDGFAGIFSEMQSKVYCEHKQYYMYDKKELKELKTQFSSLTWPG